MKSILLPRRRLLAVLIMLAVALMVSSMDIFLPALPMMRDYFGTTEYLMQLSLMISPLASALVALIFGRISDIYGRRPILFASFAFFLIGGLGCCFAHTMESFMVSRFIQAIGCGGLSVVGVVIIADMFHGIDYARYMSIYGSLFPLVFAISPILGAHITEHFGWRFCFILNFLSMLIVTLFLRALLPETIKKGAHANQGGFRELLEKTTMLLTSAEYLLMVLGHALPITLTGLFLANGSFIFIDGFGYTPTLFSLYQAVPITLNFLSSLLYRRYIGRLGLKGALRVGAVGMFGFVLGSLALVTHQVPSTAIIILAIFCLSNIAMPFVVATCATRAIEIFPDDRGLSVSIMAMVRNIFLAVIVSTAGLFFNGTILPVYIAMMLVVIVVLGIVFLALQRPLVFAGE
ncbi:MAG: multidrug effflux MFS transporter [Alphaproteobacteria bacterium]|nr:multidrug effflux MFS transporter [Alphaproteobacteria bacterium]